MQFRGSGSRFSFIAFNSATHGNIFHNSSTVITKYFRKSASRFVFKCQAFRVNKTFSASTPHFEVRTVTSMNSGQDNIFVPRVAILPASSAADKAKYGPSPTPLPSTYVRCGLIHQAQTLVDIYCTYVQSTMFGPI